MAGKAENQEAYIIGGRRYIPGESMPLCRYGDIVADVTLYQSPKGAFFTVEKNNFDNGVKVELLDKPSARALMDKHAAGIIAENYVRAFGEPKQG